MIDERHSRLYGGLVLPIWSPARRAILEGVFAGPAARPLRHGVGVGAVLPQTGLSGCGANFCLAVWHHYRCDHGQPGSITGRGRLACTLSKLRLDGRRLRAARSAHTEFGQHFQRAWQESSTDGMRAGEMSGVGDTKQLVKLRVVEKATSGAKASQISQSLIGNSVQDRNKHIGLPQPAPALADNNRGCRSKIYCNGPGAREKDVRH